MSVDLGLARCPKCGDTPSIFIRDDDDLVCRKVCREGRVDPQPAPTPLARSGGVPSRQVLREGAKPSHGLSDLAAPSRRSWGRIY